MNFAHNVAGILPPSARHIVRKLYSRRKILRARLDTEPDLSLIARVVKPGSTVVDVGANIGLYTRFLADAVGTAGRVVSLEPVPSTFDVLKYVVRDYSQVCLMNIAASDKSGCVVMDVPEYEDGYPNFYRSHISSRPSGDASQFSTRVLCDRLDNHIPSVSEVAFVKIDVEGHEPAVLRGAEQLLRSGSALWLVEAPGDASDERSQTAEVHRIFRAFGYRSFVWDGNQLSPFSSTLRPVNVVFSR